MVPLSAAIISANKHDTNAVTDVMDDAVIKRPANPAAVSAFLSTTKQRKIHLCLDRAHNSKTIEKEIINRRYVLPIQYKKKGKQNKLVHQMNYQTSKNNDGLQKEQTLGTTGLESCSQGMKRRLRKTALLDWCINYHAVSLYIER